MGLNITVSVPHAVAVVLEQKGHYWLFLSRMAQYQAVLLEQEDTAMEASSAPNPESLSLHERELARLFTNYPTGVLHLSEPEGYSLTESQLGAVY